MDQEDDDAVEAYNLELRRAMAASKKVEVEPMIAYQFSEDSHVDLDDVPLSDPDYHYDQALATRQELPFLLGNRHGGRERRDTFLDAEHDNESDISAVRH